MVALTLATAGSCVSANVERRPHLELLRFGHLGERPTLRGDPGRDFS